MKTNFTFITMLFALFMITTTAKAQETIYTDNFSYQTNWTVSGSGGSASFANNEMQLVSGATSCGRKSVLPYTGFAADSVALQFEFNSSALAFQAQLGTSPNRIQVLKDNGTDLRLGGESTSATPTNYGPKFVITSTNAWHTLLVKYKKTATTKTATFILDDGAGGLTQVVDLSLQASTYNFVLNAISFFALPGETVSIRNLKIIGTKVSLLPANPLLYSDNFTYKNNWVEHHPLNGTVSFAADPDNASNNIMKVTHIATVATANDSVTSTMPSFNITGADFTISYKYRTKANQTRLAFGTSPKRMFVNTEWGATTPSKMRICEEAGNIAQGAQVFYAGTFDVWHTMAINYNIANKTALVVVDQDKPYGTAVTADFKLQPTPYDFILNALTIRTSNADVYEIKDLQVHGIGTSSLSTPDGLSAVNEVFQNNKLNNVRVVNGMMMFTIDNSDFNTSKINLYNVLGRKVMEQTISAGTQTYSIPVKGISSGVYLLVAEVAGKRSAQKLIIQ
ncbi:MAG: T9SS type A sorting domain-containing protein [Paludibacter sp.]